MGPRCGARGARERPAGIGRCAGLVDVGRAATLAAGAGRAGACAGRGRRFHRARLRKPVRDARRMNDAGLATRAPYRPDIDGLRALSVVGVVLFHAEVPGVAGGFVGVDVFFVISGYLITQWLVTREQAGLLALLGEFYVRRARRILPALLLMLVAATVTAWWLFLPADLVRFGKYLLGAVLMSGNLAAWTEGDYFNSAIGFAPLLHLWSIAVEEQFYLLFPLLMLLMRRPV